MKRLITLLCVWTLVACGGGGETSTSAYSLGGSINGLGGASGLTLANSTETLAVAPNATNFTFSTKLAPGTGYNVTVTSQPAGLTCTVNGGAGTLAGADINTVAVRCALPPALGLFAGNLGGSHAIDGMGAAARFSYVRAIATDSVGNVYVADAADHTIRKITPAGLVSTLAGTSGLSGSDDGVGATARFGYAHGITTDGAGNIYVADTFNHTVRKITPAGVVTTLAGSAGEQGSADGTGAAARFKTPQGIATDKAGNIYVADEGNYIVRKITPAGLVSTLAGTAGVAGSVDGASAAETSQSPGGIATDSGGNVYWADTFNHTVRKITPTGVVTTLAGSAVEAGSADGTGALARFGYPQGLATDSADNVYVADKYSHTIRKITPTGVVSTLAGTAGVQGSADGVGAAAGFAYPEGIATDAAGNVYVADSGNLTIRRITPTGVVSRLAGATGYGGIADGMGAAAVFQNPEGIATDIAGNVYVNDSSYVSLAGRRIGNTIRKITPAGLVSTLAGTAGVQGSADGLGAAASFYSPAGIATDSAGNVYVTDWGTIRKITPAGLVSTLAGTVGVFGSADGLGAAAIFGSLSGIATDSAGNIYVSDSNATIRKVTPAGLVSTLAGTANVRGSVDGLGAAARFQSLGGIATDSADNVYVVDSGAIRKVTPTGLVSTLAGTMGVYGSTDGTGSAARFGYYVHGITTDSAGNIYVADNVNHTIRKITPAGVVSTLVGVAGRRGFVAGALPGGLTEPSHLAIRGTTLYITMMRAVAVLHNLP